MEVWWCGKCFIKETGTPGRWTDKHRRHFTSDQRGGRRQGNPPPAGANAAATGGSIVYGITEIPTVAPAANPAASAPSPSVLFSEAVSNAQRAAGL